MGTSRSGVAFRSDLQLKGTFCDRTTSFCFPSSPWERFFLRVITLVSPHPHVLLSFGYTKMGRHHREQKLGHVFLSAGKKIIISFVLRHLDWSAYRLAFLGDLNCFCLWRSWCRVPRGHALAHCILQESSRRNGRKDDGTLIQPGSVSLSSLLSAEHLLYSMFVVASCCLVQQSWRRRRGCLPR